MTKADEKFPATPAVRALRAAGVAFTPHHYSYLEHGGTRHAAESLCIAEHAVIKTLVMEAHPAEGRNWPLLVLMHGDCEVSTKQLARELGVKAVEPASVATVEHATGYMPGGVSPFGTRTALPVCVESSIFALDRLLVNGGRRGFLVEISPAELRRLFTPREVNVALPEKAGGPA